MLTGQPRSQGNRRLHQVVVCATVFAIVLFGWQGRGPDEPGLARAGGTAQTDVAPGRDGDPVEMDVEGDTSHAGLVAASEHVFVGRIVRVNRVENQPTSRPNRSYRVTFYAVDVEETLKGNATGRVEVRLPPGEVVGPEEGADRLPNGRPLLFFTGRRSAAGRYPVGTPGYGTIPIANDRQRANLIAEFRALIARPAPAVDQAPRQPAAGAVAPTVTLDPRSGAPGGSVMVMGRGWNGTEVRVLWGDGAAPVTALVEPDGVFRIAVTVPNAAAIGPHEITVRGTDGFAATATFQVTRQPAAQDGPRRRP